MSPPDGGPGSLLYVQMSRSTTLAGTYVTAPLTTKHFTRGAESDEFRAVQTEYERLRKLPKWVLRSGAAAAGATGATVSAALPLLAA